MINKYTLFILTFFIFNQIKSQTPDDAIRQSFQIQQGTARSMATGGAMGSLGGDLSAAYINPAGLGFYRTGEFIISSGFNFIRNKFNFRDSLTRQSRSNLVYGPIGFVFGWSNPYNNKKSAAFSLSINQVASFNNKIHYKGYNNFSSWSEQYLEELTKANADTNAALSNYIFGSSLAFRTFLVDAELQNGNLIGYQSLIPITSGIIQENTIDTRGGIHEITFGLAINQSNWYWGGSLNFPLYNYRRKQTYTETDATANPNNNFASFEYNEDYSSKGWGVNGKFGVIYKPMDRIRLGLAFHTPTFASMTDKISSSITTNTEKYAGLKSESSNKLNSGNPGVYKYAMITPWKAILSASYVFNELSDVRKQKAFISADVEYVRHQGTQYDISTGGLESDKVYYASVNQAIDQRYKGTFNFRLGAEVKFTTIMARAGLAYYGNPYEDSKVLKNDKTLLSAGLGYRDKGIFVDLTYVHSIMNDTHIPYYLSDKPNTYAQGKDIKGNIMLTFGIKF